MNATTFVAMRSDGVSLVLDISDGRLPSVLHWGNDIGILSESDVSGLSLAAVNPVGLNQVDRPVRVAILPEHWTGWMGRPGLRGSRQGSAWSPRFTTYSIEVDGAPHPGGLVNMGVGVIHVEARDTTSGLALSQTIELLRGGGIRTRASVRNLASSAYQVDGVELALPVPSVADELLDFGGRWARERVPQRHDFTLGTHLRENRKGRTGPDSAHLLHAGVPGFSFADGEVWAIHIAWSGNHTHYAEKLSSGEQVLGGGELLLPGEVVLQSDESYESPWVYGIWGDGLDAAARRLHTWLRSRDVHPSSSRPVTLNVWEAVYFDHSLTPLLELAELAASVGVERFVLDDGWFSSRRNEHSGLGDWWVSDDVWPQGLAPLIDRVTGLGMQFGLWFEPEMLNPDSVGRASIRGGSWRPIRPGGPSRAGTSRCSTWPSPRATTTCATPSCPCSGSTTSPTSSGTTTATSWRLATRGRDAPGCGPRLWPSTVCWMKSGTPSQHSRSSRAPPAEPASTWRCCSTRTGCGPRTASIRRSAN